MPRTTATDKATEKKPAAKPGPKPGAKAAAKATAKPAVKPAAAKEPVVKPTRNIGEVEMGDLPKGLTDILPEDMLRILGEAKPDTKTIGYGKAALPNDLGYIRVYSVEQLRNNLDPAYLPHGVVKLESSKTLGSKKFYIHTQKMPHHPQPGEYTQALREAYDATISEALRDGGFADYVPAAVATIGVVQEYNPMALSMLSMHDRPRLGRPERLYDPSPIGEGHKRNTMFICTREGETKFTFVLDNRIKVSTSLSAVNRAIALGLHLVTLTIGERNFTAAVELDNYPISLATLDQTLLLEYLNDAVRALLVTAWFDKLIGDVVVSEFVYTKTNVNL